MARLANTKEDYRLLFARTGNQCAFPGCNHPLIDEDDTFVAQVCHIEAARPGGPRYNSDMTDEDRRSVKNLMVLCYRHHKKTDDAESYDASCLRRMKREHESRFSEHLYEIPEPTLQRILEEQQSFEQLVARVNSEWLASFDLAMDLQFSDDPSEHLNEIRDRVSDVDNLLSRVSDFLDDLPTDIADFLDSLGYDSAVYRGVPYYDNPFVHAFWESLALGVPNSMKRIMFHSMALEAHICFAKLRVDPNDPTIRAELERLKSQLLELASSLILHD